MDNGNAISGGSPERCLVAEPGGVRGLVLSPFQSFTFTVKWMTSHSEGQLQSGASPSFWTNRDLTPGSA